MRTFICWAFKDNQFIPEDKHYTEHTLNNVLVNNKRKGGKN